MVETQPIYSFVIYFILNILLFVQVRGDSKAATT